MAAGSEWEGERGIVGCDADSGCAPESEKLLSGQLEEWHQALSGTEGAPRSWQSALDSSCRRHHGDSVRNPG